MKIKIFGDGSPYGTRIVNAETGEAIDMVLDVTLHVKAAEIPTATLTILCPEFEVTAEVTETETKYCQRNEPVDLGETIPDFGETIPVYHTNGCGKVAVYLNRLPNAGDSILAADFTLLNGRQPTSGDCMICGSCGQHLDAYNITQTIQQARAKRGVPA